MTNKGEILAARLKDYTDCYVFLHNTREKQIAEIILSEGFLFENQLPYSTDLVNPADPVEVAYFLLQRREYGNFTIVIAIRKELFDDYVLKAERQKIVLEDILTSETPFIGENEELIYRLSNRYVLGYFNNRTSELIRNPEWNASFENSKSTAYQE